MGQPQRGVFQHALALMQSTVSESHQLDSNRQFQVSQTDRTFSTDCIRFAFAVMKEKTSNFLEHKSVRMP